ncbi:peroxiredoxin [Pseudonocardia petroleophila]|uniref:Glutathione-dependent peroxiredoxin n=1 Tax=Pseudonocardia petroleophila TaxID=37331 RepID=A0A7G7MFJ7_9PSEU|nr:peroxiredoxin [Pseudonocardia petroleophila]QNG51558.1 peroxiredoxin [Pseudonocardia petroleophila]
MPAIGDRVPDATVMITPADGPGPASSAELLGSGTVVLIGVPGAFTPVCSDFHLPGFVLAAEQLKAEGVDRIAVVSVDDAFVMGAWGRSEEAGEEFLMIADPDAAFATAMGLDTDASSFGLGTRSERYAAIIRDGVITSLEVEERFVDHEVSTAEAVLARL